jgi:putative hemolysin
MFPGEVSSYKDKLMVDKPWEEAIKVIRKAQVPVVPIYFHARNSWLFYFLSKISGTLYCKITIRSFSQKRRVIKVRIGKPISVEQNEYKTTELYSEFLRKKTYMLANPYDKEFKLLTAPHLKIPRSPKRNFPANGEKIEGCSTKHRLQTVKKTTSVFCRSE